MRNCGCAGQTCGCLVVGGSGIEVTGTGTSSNPFTITNTASDLASSFDVNDTTSLDLTLAGSGTSLDPFILSGVVTIGLVDLSDVTGSPSVGDVPQWNGTSFEFAAGGGGSGTVNKYAVNVPAANPATITHSMGTLDVQVDVYTVATGVQVFPDVTLVGTNSLTLTFGSTPTVGQYRAVVLG